MRYAMKWIDGANDRGRKHERSSGTMKEKRIYYHTRAYVDISITLVCEAYALSERHPRRKRVERERASERRICVDSSDGCAIHQGDFYESLSGTTVRCSRARKARRVQIADAYAIKTIVTLYDRIKLTARAFIRAYRILTIEQ